MEINNDSYDQFADCNKVITNLHNELNKLRKEILLRDEQISFLEEALLGDILQESPSKVPQKVSP